MIRHLCMKLLDATRDVIKPAWVMLLPCNYRAEGYDCRLPQIEVLVRHFRWPQIEVQVSTGNIIRQNRRLPGKGYWTSIDLECESVAFSCLTNQLRQNLNRLYRPCELKMHVDMHMLCIFKVHLHLHYTIKGFDDGCRKCDWLTLHFWLWNMNDQCQRFVMPIPESIVVSIKIKF